jgi:uncharacterized membrane protein YbhN (UPF0104 family)
LSRIGVYLPIIGFLAFLTIAWNYFNFQKVWYYLRLADPFLIIIVIVLTSTQILTATLRYKFFLKACGEEIKINDCMRAVLTALSINSVLPGKGGDIAKALVITKNKNEIFRYTGVTIIEKLCDLIVLSLIAFIGALLVENDFWQFLSLGSIILFMSVFLFLKFADTIPLLGTKLQVLPELVISIYRNQKFFLRGIFFCTLLWMINLIIIYLLVMAVGAGVSLSKIISCWPSSMLAGMLPITISGFGTRDVAFLYALGESADNIKLLSATFLYTVFVYWFLGVLSCLMIALSKMYNLRNG